MKVQIDTNSKTIKLEGDVNLKEFIEQIKAFLPDSWGDYTLQTNTTIYNWQTPVYIDRYKPYWWESPQWTAQLKSYMGNSNETMDGTYNLEIK